MDTAEFRVHGKAMVDYMCEYMETLSERRVTPSVEPGYLRKLLPQEAPQQPETWDSIIDDVNSKIMPGVTHWQHPRFHAYFPSGNSYPAILGDMLSDIIGCIGFSWAASPACTELETIVLDWLGKAIGLPNEFLAFAEGSTGGGVIQTSASECVLVTMLAARAQAIKRLKKQHPFVEEGVLLSKLMAYCSKEAHSCVEKAAMISFVKLRILEPDDKCSLRGATLRQAMEEDEAMGLIPFFVSTTLGTTSCCSFDNLPEIGAVCERFPSVWLHVDGAYAGNAFICPELKYLLSGIEYADSFNTNPNKWLLTCFDCSTLWVRDRIRLTSALVVDPLYLQHGYSHSAIDYRHWGVPLSRRFRSLKLWFVMRSYGISGLQNYIRLHIRLAKQFEALVKKDARFEVCNEVKLGLVCFRLRGSDKLNEKLLSNINASGKMHMVPASVNDKYVIRFCAVAQNATEEDVEKAWQTIIEYSSELLETVNVEKEQIFGDFKKEVFVELNKVRADVSDQAKSLQHMSGDLDTNNKLVNEVKEEFAMLKKENEDLRSKNALLVLTVRELQKRLIINEQYTRKNNVEISGKTDTARGNGINIVKDVGTEIGVELLEDQTTAAHRVPSNRKDRSPSLVVQFQNKTIKDTWLGKFKRKKVLTTKEVNPAYTKPSVHQ